MSMSNKLNLIETIHSYLRKPQWVAALMGILTFIYGYGFIMIELDDRHIGVMAKPAIDILNGKNLFSETYSYQGTSFPYLIALLFGVFGKSIYVLNVAGLIAYSLVAVFLVLNWSRLIDYKGLWLSAVFWLAHLPPNARQFHAWPSIYALLTQLIGLYCLLLFFEKRKASLLFVVGLMTAASWSFRWTVGLMTLIGFASYFLFLQIMHANFRLKGKDWGTYLGGMFLGLLPSILYLGISGSVTDWYRQTIQGKALWAKGFGSPYFDNPLILFGYYPEMQSAPFGIFMKHWIWKLLPTLALILFVYIARKSIKTILIRSNQPSDSFYVSAGFCALILVSWHQYFPFPCTRHMYWAISLGFFLPYYLSQLLLSHPEFKWLKYAAISLMALLIAFESGERFVHGAKRIQKQDHSVEMQKPAFLRGIKISPQDFHFYARLSYVTDAIHHLNPQHKVISYVADPSIFLANEKIESFHQVFYDFHSLAHRIYDDFIPRLQERLENAPGYWLVDREHFFRRMQSIVPNLQTIASIQNKLFIVYNPSLLSQTEVDRLIEVLKAIPEHKSKDHLAL